MSNPLAFGRRVRRRTESRADTQHDRPANPVVLWTTTLLEPGNRLATPAPHPSPAEAGSPATAPGVTGRRVLLLRLPFPGDEPRDLVEQPTAEDTDVVAVRA